MDWLLQTTVNDTTPKVLLYFVSIVYKLSVVICIN